MYDTHTVANSGYYLFQCTNFGFLFLKKHSLNHVIDIIFIFLCTLPDVVNVSSPLVFKRITFITEIFKKGKRKSSLSKN